MNFMNKIVLILVFVMALTGCASNKTASLSSVGTGTSFETAVTAKSVNSEYEWIRNNYPGSKVQSQALVKEKGKYYDVLTVTLADGSKKAFYFDISSFYGKMF